MEKLIKTIVKTNAMMTFLRIFGDNDDFEEFQPSYFAVREVLKKANNLFMTVCLIRIAAWVQCPTRETNDEDFTNPFPFWSQEKLVNPNAHECK